MTVIEPVFEGEYVKKLRNTNLTGTILDIHSKSLYFQFDDAMVLCCSSMYGYIPFAISLSDEDLSQLKEYCKASMSLRFEDSKLIIPDANIEIVVPVFEEISFVDKIAEERFESFAKAAEEKNLQACKTVLNGLIGLGDGLTPAGDDLVIGYLYAMQRAESDKSFYSELADYVCSIAEHNTTKISRQYINSVCEGSTFELLQSLYDALVLDRDIEYQIMRLSRVGNSSGKEMSKAMIRYFRR